MNDNRQFSWGGLIAIAAFLVGVLALSLAAAHKYHLGPFAPTPAPTATPGPTPLPAPTPTPGPSVTLIDYGRLTAPIPGLRIEESAGALIIYIVGTDYVTAIESLDPVAELVIEAGDPWIYYFDTLSNGTLYFIIRCNPADISLPAAERRCQTAQPNPGQVLTSYLYDNGFESRQN